MRWILGAVVAVVLCVQNVASAQMPATQQDADDASDAAVDGFLAATAAKNAYTFAFTTRLDWNAYNLSDFQSNADLTDEEKAEADCLCSEMDAKLAEVITTATGANNHRVDGINEFLAAAAPYAAGDYQTAANLFDTAFDSYRLSYEGYSDAEQKLTSEIENTFCELDLILSNAASRNLAGQ